MDLIERLRNVPGRGFYAMRNNEQQPAFIRSDLIIPPPMAQQIEPHTIAFNLTTFEQGYGLFHTWLTGDLESFDAFEIALDPILPQNFSFGVGYVHDQDPKYYSHIHVLADFHHDNELGNIIRKGPINPGKYASVQPKEVLKTPQLKPLDGLGFIVKNKEIAFFRKPGDGLAHLLANLYLNKPDSKNLRAYFEVYFEEDINFNLIAQNPGLS
ncbi:MAG: hypothetical protein H6510_14240 [Acidobacteria bacterium]|nr:hypothetical protein [Acidobacteriota bacterium]MCB9398969.1 hypothetical protein [Acidobacteriota bacterium]